MVGLGCGCFGGVQAEYQKFLQQQEGGRRGQGVQQSHDRDHRGDSHVAADGEIDPYFLQQVAARLPPAPLPRRRDCHQQQPTLW